MTPRIHTQDTDFTLWHGDALETLRLLADGSVDCCVTSPPYWGLRDYGQDGQLGLESTPDEYVTRIVQVFREVRRVLADTGTLWCNLGDSYHGGGYANHAVNGEAWLAEHGGDRRQSRQQDRINANPGLKPKDLVGIPWRVAFALQADGWYLRSDIIWSKPNPMPESVTDRPTKSHEYVFLLSKQPRYWFDQEAVRETGSGRSAGNNGHVKGAGRNDPYFRTREGFAAVSDKEWHSRNVRSVWEIATQPYSEAHFATYPEELVRRCLLAGCPEWVCGTCGKARERIVERVYGDDNESDWAQRAANGAQTGGVGKNFREVREVREVRDDCGHDAYRHGVVLDPFGGSGTTGLVARKHGRSSVLIELSEDYCALAARRLQQLSLLADTNTEAALTGEDAQATGRAAASNV